MSSSNHSTFTCFKSLPLELRLLIWEHHFLSPRIHVVHPAPESSGRMPPREVLLFNCTVIDADTNLELAGGPTPSPNREAEAVRARLLRRQRGRGEPVDLAWNLVKPYVERRTLGDGETLSEGQIEAAGTIPHFRAWRDANRTVHVDWRADLLYLSVPHAEQAFWSLRYVAWRARVRRLALLVPESHFEDGSRRPIPFGPSQFIREVLEGLAALEDLFIVLVPPDQVAGAGGTATATATTTSSSTMTTITPTSTPTPASPISGEVLKRGPFGFVPYVDYLKKVGLTSNHMPFARAALSFQQALANLPRDIRMLKVVDIDRTATGFGEYRRNWRV
ncbi:hypothetical protein F4809DRAFT_329175 [Biscogniauxia mediterranea]|nr:hypothetical protein F4809DRAFT_329175 [Biscogniauxia mediterranea]